VSIRLCAGSNATVRSGLAARSTGCVRVRAGVAVGGRRAHEAALVVVGEMARAVGAIGVADQLAGAVVVEQLDAAARVDDLHRQAAVVVVERGALPMRVRHAGQVALAVVAQHGRRAEGVRDQRGLVEAAVVDDAHAADAALDADDAAALVVAVAHLWRGLTLI